MSAMLGVEDLDKSAMKSEEINKSSEEKSNKKKVSPSIKNFFQSVTQENVCDKSACSKNNIKKFFLSSPPDKIQDPVSIEIENCIEKATKPISQESNKRDAFHHTCTKDNKANLVKKTKPKWALTLKASKKSEDGKFESDYEDITQVISKADYVSGFKDEIQHFGKEDLATRKHKKNKSSKNRQDIKVTNIIVKRGDKPSLKEEVLIDEVSKKSKKEKSKIDDKGEDNPPLGTKRHSKNNLKDTLFVATNSPELSSVGKCKKKDNALEILMIHSRDNKICQNENILEKNDEHMESVEEDEKLSDCEPSQNSTCSDQEGGKRLTKASTNNDSQTANAFDVLMMKKSLTNNANESAKSESPKKFKHKPNSFKLSIHYYKSSNDSDSEVELDKSNIDFDCHQNSKFSKKEKRKHQGVQQFQQNDATFSPPDKTPKEPSIVGCESSMECSSNKEESHGEPKAKLTKVKKKKKVKMQKSDDFLGTVSPIMVQDDSNSSVIELTQKTTEEKDIKSSQVSSILKSSGSEDFEVTPVRTGLRKRKYSVNYVLMNEPKPNDDKKKKEKKKKCKDKKKDKSKNEQNLKHTTGDNKEECRKKDKGKNTSKGTLLTSKDETLILEKNTAMKKNKMASATKEKVPIIKEKRAQGATVKRVSGSKEKGASSKTKKGTSAKDKADLKNKYDEHKVLGTKENRVTDTQLKGAQPKEKGAPRTKDKQRHGTNKEDSLLIASDTSPNVEVVKSFSNEKAEKSITASQKLAPIFLKQKLKERSKNGINLANIDAEGPTTLAKMTPVSTKAHPSHKLNAEELKAANSAFLSLFAGSKAIKAAQKPAGLVNQQPTPWPAVSHVTQWDEGDQSDGRLDLINKKLVIKDKPIENTKFLNLRLKLGELTTCLSGDIVLKTNIKKVDNLALHPTSPEVVKKFLSETLSFFPGIPLRRLYKQYKSKQDEYQAEVVTEDIQERDRAKNEIKTEKVKASSAAERVDEEDNKPPKIGRTKRKKSTQSDEEQNEKQVKKPRKKKQKEKQIEEEETEVETKHPVSEQPRKKRGREEGKKEAERGDNSKRKSSRKSKATTIREQEDQRETKPNTASYKRKKRKTMEDDHEVTLVAPTETVKVEDSRSSMDEKRADLLWTEKYQPECSSEVMGNASAVSRLKSWLEAWKIKREKTLRKELQLQRKLLEKQKNKDKQGKKSNPEWLEEDYDSDFHLSDEDDENDSEDSGLSSAMLVLGPRGSGKTATVYACAKELGYKVFEVNCSSKRSSKQILSKLEEATQSHLVITNPTASIPKASAFGGLFANITSNSYVNSPVSNFIARPNKRDGCKNEEKKKTAKEKDRKLLTNEKKGTRNDLLFANECSGNPRPGLKAVSLILFEEVDLVFEDDKGFWSAVTSFINNAKCPIIMTSSDSRVGCDGRYDQLILKTPSTNLLSAHLHIAALINNVFVHPNELKSLVSLYKCDIRKCLLALQFWIMSGGGRKMKWKKFLKEKERGNLSTVVSANSVKLKSSQSSQNKAAPTHTELTILNDRGEESVLLTADDWKKLTRTTRTSKRGATTEPEDQFDSDFEIPKTLTVDENTHTDSILVECNESRSEPIVEDHDKEITMPGVHSMLVEHTLGLVNTTLAYKHGCLDLLKYRSDTSKMSPSTNKQRLTEHSQSLDINLTSYNLPYLLPSLYEKPSANQIPSSVARTTTMPIKTLEERLDRSVFDDGSESNEGDSSRATETMETKELDGTSEESSSNADNSEMKEDTATKLFKMKTLEIFTSLSEDLSFLDAFTTSTYLNENQQADYGWWHARASSGLSDEVGKVNRTSPNWWTRDTSVCIRGALEIASFDYACVRYQSLVDEGLVSNVNDYFPGSEKRSVVNLNGLTDDQLGKITSANKLYRTVKSSLSLVTICSRRSTCTDYLPTLRSICHSERLRELGNTKRRFLHYLDSVSSMSDSTMQSLADAHLAS